MHNCSSNLPVAGAEITEADGLLWGQVDHDEAVDTSFLAILEHTLLAVLEDRVEVSHQHEGSLQATATGVTDKLQDGGKSDTILEGLGVGSLNGRAIGNWVCEGDSELNDVCIQSELVKIVQAKGLFE